MRATLTLFSTLALTSSVVFADTAVSKPDTEETWTVVDTTNTCTARHEASMVTLGDKLYLIGGRRKVPVNEYDPATKTWKEMAKPPFQMHHFQAVVIDDKIAIIGAFTGGYPYEKPIPNVWYFDPKTNSWEEGAEIPAERRRGAAGVVVDGDDVYVVGGIVNGHWDGFVPWLDRWNTKTGEWTVLPDAPNERDHFQAGIIDNKIVAAGGRRTHAAVKQTFNRTIAEVDAFDIASGEWTTLEHNLPTKRAGTMAATYGDTIFIAGGESGSQKEAHAEVERFSFSDGEWHQCTPLAHGRHGGGMCVHGDDMFLASGSGNRGGGPELDTIEMIDISDLLQ